MSKPIVFKNYEKYFKISFAEIFHPDYKAIPNYPGRQARQIE